MKMKDEARGYDDEGCSDKYVCEEGKDGLLLGKD